MEAGFSQIQSQLCFQRVWNNQGLYDKMHLMTFYDVITCDFGRAICYSVCIDQFLYNMLPVVRWQYIITQGIQIIKHIITNQAQLVASISHQNSMIMIALTIIICDVPEL